MPSIVTLPFIQCHQVRGRADCGGSRKERKSDSESIVADSACVSMRDAESQADKTNTNAMTNQNEHRLMNL